MIISQTKELLEVFISMSSEKDGEVLLERMLNAALDITNCDGGTLYILNEDVLEFRFMMTRSLNIKKGGKNEQATLPPVQLDRKNVCAYSVLEEKAINIPDVYSSELFDFAGPKQYDLLTNYRTKSMLVIPMENDKGTIIGVLQLLNAQDKDGQIISFSEENEMILTAIASQAAIRLTNMNYVQEIEELMDSIVKTFAEIMHIRTPYNVSHTHNMARYATKFLMWLSDNPQPDVNFTDEDAKLFLMSIWLHDIGKLTTPLEVMNKKTRLERKHERVMTRFDIISLTTKLRSIEQGKDYTDILNDLEDTRTFINDVNLLPYLDEDTLEKIRNLGTKTYLDEAGNPHLWLTEDEIEDLTIVKGTLTEKEKGVMQNHVSMTKHILEKMNFKNQYQKVPQWANNHHEFLDGSGYPNRLKGDEIDIPTRLLTIIDVFDAISASDRPYKKAFPIDHVFQILNSMVDSGKLDGRLLALFKQSQAWL